MAIETNEEEKGGNEAASIDAHASGILLSSVYGPVTTTDEQRCSSAYTADKGEK